MNLDSEIESNFDEIFITGCPVSCLFDDFQSSQWWHIIQTDDISVTDVNTILNNENVPMEHEC